MLNLVLHGLAKRQVDPAQLEFLAVDEHIVDIGDDMFDYEVRLLPPFSVQSGFSHSIRRMP